MSSHGEPGGFKPWPVEWRPEWVKRYWDWWSARPSLEHLYFSKRLGDSIVQEMRRSLNMRGVLLDVGCGTGFFLEKALRQGLQVLGVDSSADSVAAASARLGTRAGFLDARVGQGDRLPFEGPVADIVTLIEVVEHVADPVLDALLADVFRVTRSGGYVVVTTPNDEMLAELEVMCPSCGCVFHQFQHLRSFSPVSLSRYLEAAGFVTCRCTPLLFSFLPPWMRPFHRWLYPRVKGRLPHLMYVGRKP